MIKEFSSSTPWVIFSLRKQVLAVMADSVREMVIVPKVTEIPRAPQFVRGVINLRGQVFPLIDLRHRLGMQSVTDEAAELIELLTKREEEHQAWLTELEASVREGRAFTLTTDPHKCAFGQWYDKYTTENVSLSGVLQKFDRPHRRIHALAARVEDLIEAGRKDDAYRIIEQTRDTDLAAMIELFEQARKIILNNPHEVALVLESEGTTVAASVDSVKSVETLSQENVEEVPPGLTDINDELIAAVARRNQDDSLVLILDVDSLTKTADELAENLSAA